MTLAIVVLAAGCSSRLGQPKQLVAFKEQSSEWDKTPRNLLEKQCLLASKITKNSYCVLGYQANLMMPYLAGCQPIENLAWQQGLGTSISCAVRAIGAKYQAILFVLVDQWQVADCDLIELIEQHQKSAQAIIVSDYLATNGQQLSYGPPVIFPQPYFADLLALKGEQGAKAVIEQVLADTTSTNIAKPSDGDVCFVTINKASVDLDTPAQLASFKEYINNK